MLWVLIMAGLIILINTLSKLLLKVFSVKNDLGKKANYSITAISLVISTIAYRAFVPAWWYYIHLLLFPIILFVITTILTLIQLKINNPLTKSLKGYLPFSILLTFIFYLFFHYNFHWHFITSTGISGYVNSSTNPFFYCIGFPFPCQARFWQMNSGESLVNPTYLSLDLLIYFLLGFGIYYLLLKRINLNHRIPKVILALTYCLALFYYYYRFFDSSEMVSGWVDNVQFISVYFSWGI